MQRLMLGSTDITYYRYERAPSKPAQECETHWKKTWIPQLTWPLQLPHPIPPGEPLRAPSPAKQVKIDLRAKGLSAAELKKLVAGDTVEDMLPISTVD